MDESLSYSDLDYELEMQNNVYNFEVADTDLLFKLFDLYEAESKRVIETKVGWDDEKGVLSASVERRASSDERERSRVKGQEEPLSPPGLAASRPGHPGFDPRQRGRGEGASSVPSPLGEG